MQVQTQVSDVVLAGGAESSTPTPTPPPARSGVTVRLADGGIKVTTLPDGTIEVTANTDPAGRTSTPQRNR